MLDLDQSIYLCSRLSRAVTAGLIMMQRHNWVEYAHSGILLGGWQQLLFTKNATKLQSFDMSIGSVPCSAVLHTTSQKQFEVSTEYSRSSHSGRNTSQRLSSILAQAIGQAARLCTTFKVQQAVAHSPQITVPRCRTVQANHRPLRLVRHPQLV